MVSATTFTQCGKYSRLDIEKALAALLQEFGGMKNIISPGDSVLLKANMLSASTPEECITTHPEVVRAVAVQTLEAGGKPFIADSPGIDRFSDVARKTGMETVARELGIPCVELDDPVPLPVAEGNVFQRIEVSRRAVEADTIINIPKLKTHAQMMLTLGVKNLFGTVVSQRKAQWHYNVGLRREAFADLHLDIARGLAPRLTILDGIRGMEGRGPSNGKPRDFGILAASSDPLDLDFRVCTLLGAPLEEFPLYRAARERGLVDKSARWDAPGLPEEFEIPPIELPKLDALHLLPPFLDRFGKRFLASRPVQEKKKCIRCGKCVEICPAGAMNLTKAGDVEIDYEKCIRCYCCQEVCPADAIRFSKGLLLRVLEGIRR